MRRFGKAKPVRQAGGAPAAQGGSAAPDLAWVPEFWASVREYVCVREEDEVLILPPNMVYKTNRTGIGILRWLDSGKPLRAIPGMDASRLNELASFLGDIRDLCAGKAVTTATIPYDFDFSRLPILGELAVTYRCNNACRFCYAGCGSGSTCGPGGTSGELGLSDLKRIVDVFKEKAKIPFFSLTGGEPLLRPEIEDLTAYAVSRGLRVNLITNATLATRERAASLFAAGLRTAQVSLESPDPAIHDGLCGREGSHGRTLAGIEALQAAGISVQTNSTVTRANRESLLAMPAFLGSLGIRRFSMNLYIPAAGPARDFPAAAATAAELFVPYSDIGAFVDRIAGKAASNSMTFYWYSPTPLCIFNPMARGLGNKSCAAADGLIHVDPAGRVLPCSSFPESLGSLLVQDFASIWFSARARHFKQKQYAPEACSGCDSFKACQAACPLYWDYAGTDELDRTGARTRRSAPALAGQAR